MLLGELFGVEGDIYLVEDDYAGQRELSRTLEYLPRVPGELDAVKLVCKDGGGGLALAVWQPEGFWAVFTNIVAVQSNTVQSNTVQSNSGGELFPGLVRRFPARVREVTSGELLDAVREYYSRALVEREFCEQCSETVEPFEMVYIKSRIERLEGFLKDLGIAGSVMEMCCGNGMATLALRRLGISPLAFDNDKCQICQGLEQGALEPRRTMVLDATLASRYFPARSFDWITGFMLGTICSFNTPLWTSMMREAAVLVKNGGSLLFTVNKREEIEVLHGALEELGIQGEILDNRDEGGIYDQWVYLAEKI